MAEMNRTTAGHGTSGNPFDWIDKKIKGRANAMQQGINTAAYQHAEHEHEINKMVVGHVLAKDYQTHLSKHAADSTEISMQHGDITTKITRKPRKSKGAQAVTPTEHVETPASTPHAAEAESTPRAEHHSGNATFVGGTIPTHPGTWEGGYLEHGPKGKARVKPGYSEFKSRKQHFETGLASQQGHFAVKEGIKIPNYARKALKLNKPKGK